MNTLIIGSGFGLYGYLPSIIDFSKKIYLSIKYKKKVENRKDLKKYLNRINWYLNLYSISDKIDCVVIAQKPKNQHEKIIELIKYIKPKIFFLEKPLSNTPKNSLSLIKSLSRKKIKFVIGFMFKYLNWYKFCNRNINQNQKFKIIWEIKPNKKNNFWKFNHLDGGGITRFYAIHFFRLLFDLNFKKINYKKITKKKCYIIASDVKKNFFDICIKFSKSNNFKVFLNNKKKFNGPNPFLKKINKDKDPRIIIIKKYIADNLKKKYINYDYEKNFILFWKKLEKNID